MSKEWCSPLLPLSALPFLARPPPLRPAHQLLRRGQMVLHANLGECAGCLCCQQKCLIRY